MNMFYKNLSMWLVIGLTMILLFNLFSKPHTQIEEMSYTDFLSSVEQGTVNKVVIQGNEITGIAQGGSSFKAIAPPDLELIPTLRKQGVNIQAKQHEETPWY
ncbi:MAG: cell division protein FtsH, partial [Desulfobulbaceae bacterium]|nr:cell division protein FtsH [Desulfobulbaceae bacterium]